jgi:hypothetical protein
MKPEEFPVFSWAGTIPLCDDLWLRMQAQNVAIVDMTIIRDIEAEALARFYQGGSNAVGYANETVWRLL